MGSLMPEKELIPKEIGNYKITGRLGKGGMGDIYRAIQKSLDRVVALKVLSPQMGRSSEFSERFVIEAKAISRLEHHNVVSIYEYGEENEMKYFAMQFVDGEDLGQRIAKSKSLPFEVIIDYAKQICRGLRYAHEQKIVHRDIKPQNILLDKSSVCKLSDFGIAKIFEQSNLTMTGMAVGTPEYMSPEQAEGLDLDEQTDIYSLGVVIYEMITKRPPFTGNNPIAIAYKQVHELPLPPSAFRKDVPKRLELIVMKALKKNRLDRYKTVEGMLKDLDTVDLSEPSLKDTIAISKQKKSLIRNSSTTATVDKRITDRRNGSRRFSNNSGDAGDGLFGFLRKSIQEQALSLFLIAILAIILFGHILITALK